MQRARGGVARPRLLPLVQDREHLAALDRDRRGVDPVLDGGEDGLELRAAHAERGELVPGELGGAEVDEVGNYGGDAGVGWVLAIEGGRSEGKRGEVPERRTYAVIKAMFSFLMRLRVP